MKRVASIRIIAAFSVFVMAIVAATSSLIGAVSVIFSHFGLLDRRNPMMVVLIFGLASVIISTMMARVFGRRGISPIIKITEATKEIAKGNYAIRLNENIKFSEVKEMAQNFNLMAQELGNTETFRGDFIANVSHEFKTPISAIEGYAVLLQNKDISEAERDDYIARILSSTKRLSNLSASILQISRLENQQLRPPSKEFSLDEQLRQIILLYEPIWTQKKIALDIDLESVVYNGNQNMLAQVWQNIFENAIKFAPQDGTVRVMLKAEEGLVRVSFSDNGAGMPEEVLSRIFEKFYQGDKSHSSAGNGLGLTLAKRIVDLHGGAIEAESKPGQGTVFIVSLPV